jgi:hypothetical protein
VSRARLVDVTVTVASAFALFCMFFHPAILDPYNVGWLLRGTDNGENALGLHAWLNDPAAHGLRTMLLNAPDGVPLLFTDSNPLLALMVRPIAALMSPGVQFVGPWYLMCLVLQVGFARALVRPHAANAVIGWLGALVLCLLPTLYARYVHANLFAHWLLLAALWLFVDQRHAADWRWWTALLVGTALIHNYLLVMVAAFWASAMLERWWHAPSSRGKLVVGAMITVGAVLLAISALQIGGGFANTYTYRTYAMPLDALWNPSNPSYSNFLPATEQRLRRAFEGFQYLGAGLLLIVAAMPFALRWAPPVNAIGAVHHRLLWLVPAGVVLTVVAVSHEVDWAGRTLFTLPLPHTVIGLLDPLRASSRLFWPVAYVLVFAAVLAAFRLPRRRTAQLLGAALVLQLADMTTMMVAMRKVTKEASQRRAYTLTTDPRWTDAIAGSRDVTFVPPTAILDLHLFQEVAWRAVLAGKPVRLVYAARDGRSTLARLRGEQDAFDHGLLAPDRLYVLFPQATIPPGAAPRLRVLNGVRILVPLSASSPRSAS